MRHFKQISQTLAICAFFASASSCKRVKDSSASTKEAANEAAATDVDANMEIEMIDVDLPGPMENLLSLVYGAPVFSDGGKTRTALRYDPKAGLDPVNAAMSALQSRPDLKGIIKIEDGGTQHLVAVAARETTLIQKFHGVCIDNYTFALAAALPSGSTTILSDANQYELRLVASMPPAMRPDLKSCRERFLELVDIKFKGSHDAAAALHRVDTLHLLFSWMPLYLGASEFSEGKTAKGIALITGDIITVGLFSKFRAGWSTLRMSQKTFEAARTGARMTLIGANAVILGSLLKDASQHKLNPAGVMLGILVLTQGGYTIHKLVVKPPLPK